VTIRSSDIDERLVGRRPPEELSQTSRARLSALFQQRFEQREAERTEHRLLVDSSTTLVRNLAKDDATLERTIKEAQKRSSKRAKHAVPKPKRSEVKARAHLGSIDITFVPPYTWPWQWSASTGTASANVSVDAQAGSMGFDAWTGQDGKTASCAVAVGSYFQPFADAGIMDVSASPAFNYVWDSSNVFDSSHSGAFIGLYVGQYTLGGEFVQAVVDQQIRLWDSGGGSDQGGNSGYPLVASTPVDSDHFYEIWVWSGGDAEADGWSAFWGSAALSAANLVVPWVSVHAY
jgi:hypothetical protein